MKLVYTGIRVRDLKRSVEFYTKTMGMKEIRRGKMREGAYLSSSKARILSRN
jgi:catechol 2,3-dioxygenase-like lactoylglutathione lyase family enzyme